MDTASAPSPACGISCLSVVFWWWMGCSEGQDIEDMGTILKMAGRLGLAGAVEQDAND